MNGKAIKKEAAGQATGKGDRWADFNLLRTGRIAPLVIKLFFNTIKIWQKIVTNLH